MEDYIEKNIELIYNVLSFVIEDHPDIDNKFKLTVNLLDSRNKTIIRQNKEMLHNILIKIKKLQNRQDEITDEEFYNELYKEVIKNI